MNNMEYTYGVGDRVIVSDKLLGDSYLPIGGLYVAPQMLEYAGREVTISHIIQSTKDERYRIEEDDGNWVWSTECFTGLAKEGHYEIEDIGMLYEV